MLDNIEEVHKDAKLPIAASSVEQLDADALRQRVRDYSAANGTSLRSIGLLCGVTGESTFTAWVSSKYKGNNEGIDEKVRIWLRSEEQLSHQRLILPAEVKFAATPTAIKFINVLEYAQAMPDIVVISGGAGVGKTKAVKRYQETRPNVWVLTAEPSLSSHSKMMEYLREVLSIPVTAKHQISRAVAAKLLDTQGLVVVDEAQHLTPKCIDQLRSVFDRAGVGLALVGNEEVWSRIDGGGRKTEYAQLYSRVGMRVTVTRPSMKDIDVLLDAAEISGTKQRSVLRTIGQKPGALRGMMKTLRTARLAAAGAKQELSEEHVAAAWNRRMGTQEVVL